MEDQVISPSRAVSPVKHSLKFYTSYISGTKNVQEFVERATVDDIEIGSYDSIKEEPKLKDDLGKLNEEFHQLYRLLLKNNREELDLLKKVIDGLKQPNQTGESYTLQSITGCESIDNGSNFNGFGRYGLDGEDFYSRGLLNKGNAQESNLTKHFKDAITMRMTVSKQICGSSFLEEYMNYGKISLQRTELPTVSLLQKSPSSPVICHATGFYPHIANLLWRKYRNEIHEGVEKGQILPNHDGTFQMSSELNASLIKQEDWRHYDCVAQLSGVENNIITTLDEKKILTNFGLGVAGVAVFPRDVMVPFLVAIFLVFCIFKKRIQDHLAACGSRLADLLCGVPSSRWCREDPGKDTTADILLSCHESQPDQQRPRHEPRAARLKSRLKSRPRHLHLSKKIKLLLNVITRSHSGILRMVKFHLLIMALNEAISSLQHLPLEKTSSDTTIA